MQLDVRGIESSKATEIYVTAVPTPGTFLGHQAQEAFAAIARILASRNAWICQERTFADPAATPILKQARAAAYGKLDDGVEPNYLGGARPGTIAGIQVHAVAGLPAARPVIHPCGCRGRVFEQNGCKWIVASALSAPDAGEPHAQARATFQKAQSLLALHGADFKNVARTWLFMDDILSWYHQLNDARSDFFEERGLIGPDADGRLPASTGIGVSPVTPGKIDMDLFAVVGPEGSVQRFHAAGKQRSAFEYGSAFARAATAQTPAGQTIFVSGTAAIDAAGATCFVNDIAGQIRMTINNVIAVLRDLGCGSKDVVQAIAYCATPKVAEAFHAGWANKVAWPWLTVHGDVCRDDLLFEVEATACPGARRW